MICRVAERALAGVVVIAALSACPTAQVQEACADAQQVLGTARPYLGAAPASVQLAATAIGAGTYVCGTPEYAAARERVIAYVRGLTISRVGEPQPLLP